MNTTCTPHADGKNKSPPKCHLFRKGGCTVNDNWLDNDDEQWTLSTIFREKCVSRNRFTTQNDK